ncbi:hypothetical protein V5799_017840 [Amblyomma americanum]|uniref:Uncharacterized protein n=1 Tax=Amblyomma americanum TaxID=6943 RepID=A0AAQ4F1G5_AMBAM
MVLINYLVLSTSDVSLQQMKAYKSLEAHNYFTSGRVKSDCHASDSEACRRSERGHPFIKAKGGTTEGVGSG